MADKTVIEILTTQVGVTVSSLDFKDALIDGQQRHIESTATEVEDQNVALAAGLLVKSVRDGSSSGLVDNAEHFETSDGAGILGGLTLTVVEVSRDGDDSLLHCSVEVRLRDVAHLGKHHRGNLLGGKRLGLALVLHLQHRLVPSSLCDGERPVLHVILDSHVVELTTNEALGVEHTAGQLDVSTVNCGNHS